MASLLDPGPRARTASLRETHIDSSTPAAGAARLVGTEIVGPEIARPDVDGADAAARARRCEAMLAHPVAAVAVVEAGRIRTVNACWRRLFAMSPDPTADVSAPVGTAALFASVQVAERFERALAERLAEAREDEDVHAALEHPLVRVDGTGFLGELLVWPLGNREQGCTGSDAIWQVRDVTAERALHAELRDLDGYHKALGQHQRDLTFVIDRKGRIAYVSPSVDATLGYPDGSLLGQRFAVLFEPGHRSDTERWLRQQAIRRLRDDDRGASEDFRLHVVAHDGRRLVLACHPHDCFDVPRLSGMVLHARDMTAELDQASRHATAETDRERLRGCFVAVAAMPPAPGPDRVASILQALCVDLEAATALWSVSRDDEAPRVVARRTLRGGADDVDDAASAHAVAFVQAVDRTAPAARAVDDVARDGFVRDRRERFEQAGVAAFVDVPVRIDARTHGYLTVGAARRRAWTPVEIDHVSALAPVMALAWAASSEARGAALDALTSLIGRVEAERRLAERVADRLAHPSIVVLVINIDRMRELNDRHGHAIGDRVIGAVAGGLAVRVGNTGFVARIGGDEFLVVREETEVGQTEAWVQALMNDVGSATSDAQMPRVEASVGVARLAVDSPDAQSLWRKADLAMREAKGRGRGQAVFFDPRMSAAIAARAALGAEIEGALDRDEFALFYQPQIALASGKLVGLEALLRWQHPTRGLLLPHLFIEAAIDRGLIDAITKVAFGQVCDQIVRWQKRDGFPEVPVSVNVSARQFHDRRLPALVASALLRVGLPARLLILELSELNFTVDSAATERVVKELALLGVRIAIGNFGLNPTALRSLRQLRVSQIKLDRGFVEGLPDDRESAIAVTAAIEIGRNLKCQVIAEGVETPAQFESLRDMHCEAGQGFHFAAPLSVAELQAFVETRDSDAGL